MTEPTVTDHAVPAQAGDDKVMPIVIYVLYLVGFCNGLTVLAGFILAYVLKGKAMERTRSHYVFQIRSVWIALVGFVLGAVIFGVGLPLTLIAVGLPLLFVAWGIFGLIGIWFVVRCVVGLTYIARDEAYPRPQAWLI